MSIQEFPKHHGKLNRIVMITSIVMSISIVIIKPILISIVILIVISVVILISIVIIKPETLNPTNPESQRGAIYLAWARSAPSRLSEIRKPRTCFGTV